MKVKGRSFGWASAPGPRQAPMRAIRSRSATTEAVLVLTWHLLPVRLPREAETLAPVRITRPHAAGIQDSLKDPSVVEPPAPEPRPAGSDPAPATILLPGQGRRQGAA